MTKLQTVVFDLGKVLLDFDYGKSSRLFAARSKASANDVEKLINHSPLLYRYETGLMTREEFYREVTTTTSFHGTIEEFGEIFADIFEPIPQMVELQATLRKRGIPTFIFSNTNDLAIGHIRQKYPFFGNFDGYVLSYEHGAMKPTAKLYEVVERETGRRGSEIIYLDDRAENVDAGAARGWQAILHETPAKSLVALRAAGLDV
ncbi:MAG TPA: HAD family phosphatase [Verrucomicrobiae bacterium]|jgi:2-haloacid dehalogenase|nr:HAD family phosphatase [Verrucomicrobiae bacterium]